METTELVSPPSQHKIWKASWTRSDRHMTSQSAQLIPDKIVNTLDSFVPHGHNDILTTIRILEHPTIVHDIVGSYGIRDHLAPPQRTSVESGCLTEDGNAN